MDELIKICVGSGFAGYFIEINGKRHYIYDDDNSGIGDDCAWITLNKNDFEKLLKD